MNENTLQFAWFARSDKGFEPLEWARGRWRKDQLHGVAVSGLLARAVEQEVIAVGREDLIPARYHVDLFRPALMHTLTTTARVVRESARLLLVDATVEQDGEVVSRASATFLKPSTAPGGEVWSADDRPTPPPLDVAPDDVAHHIPVFSSAVPWSDDFAAHQNSGRHTTWQIAVPILADEECTPFQAAASIADATSMVTCWGSNGVEYINTDIDLALSRRPDGVALGLRATDHVAHDGIVVGTVEVFDRQGMLGTASVTSLANTRRTVDFSDGVAGPDSA